MAAGLLPEKVIGDIQECISKLGEDFNFNRIPINDDNTNLHRFCSKLEFLLQNGMKDQGSLLRRRREYWDYFYHCLSSSHGNGHDGLKFVKSHPELKTPLARGRTFIRFCLVRQCLADTLQCCFMNDKVTSSFYHERSVLRQEARVSLLLSSLYELNDMQFDLSPRGHDLDLSWPTFARKLFDSSHLWQPPSRSVSISSLSSCVSQNDNVTTQPHSRSTPNIKEIEELRAEIERLENSMEELQQKLHRSEQQEELSRLLAEEREQQLTYLTKQLEEERNVHKISISNLEENTTKLQSQWQQEKNQLTENLNICIETSKEHTEKLSQVSVEFENKNQDCRELQAKIVGLEEENNNISSHSLQLEKDLEIQKEHLQTEVNRSSELDKLVLELKNENETLRHQIKEESASSHMSLDEVTAQSCKELTKKLETTEASLVSLTSEKEGLNRSLGKVEHINSILQQLVNTVERENTKLKEQLAIVESNMARTQVNLEKCQAVKTDLENEMYEMRTELKNVHDKNNETVRELEAAKKFPIELITALEKVMHSLNADSLQSIERLCYSWIVDYRLREKINSFLAVLKQKAESSGVDAVQQSTDACCSSPCHMQNAVSDLYKKEALVIGELQKELDGCLQETLKLSCQMCVLKDKLHLDYGKVSISPLSDSDLVDKTASSVCDNSDGIPTEVSSAGNILLDEANSNTNRLNKLSAKAQKLCHNLEAFRHLNHCLIAKVQDQERKLSGIAQELEATQKLMSALKLQHNKLQTSEAITRYELKEKRKLLVRLRTQLESTREDWHRMRKNYSDSEAEWQSLRAEFAKRHKQASEESGFIDCGKNYEENEVVDGSIEIPAASSPLDISESSPRDDSMMTDCSVQLSSSCEGAEGGKVEEITEDCSVRLSSSCEGAEGGKTEEITEPAAPKTRLELLEEECKLLHQNLVNSVTKSDNLEQRVQSLAYTVHSSHRRSATRNSDSLQQASSVFLPTEQLVEDSNEVEDSDSILLDNPCATMMEEDPALLDNTLSENELHEASEEAMDDIAEPSTEENELDLPTADNYSDLSSSTSTSADEEDHAIQTEAEEEMHYLRRQALQGFVQRFLNERVRHEAQEAELNSRIEVLKKSNSKLEEELEQLRKERNELLTRETDFRKRTEYIFRKERESFNLQLDNFEAERSKLHKNFEKLTAELLEASDRVKVLENRLHETTEELNKVRQVKEEEVSSLQFQLSTESLKCERALKYFTEQEAGIAVMKKKINDQEYLILTLRESLLEIKEEREIERQQHHHELDELQLSLSTRDEECTKMNEDLKKIAMELDKEKQLSNQLQSEVYEAKEQNKRLVSQHNSELSEIKSDNTELKKNLVRLIREKDKLWKHSERLSHQQKVQFTDRWMEDSETDSCLGCKVAFSFTIRKHHCRLCGRIFCHSCSNNWLLIASRRSHARICNECFLHHIELQAEAGNVCAITNMVEDNESESEIGIPIEGSSHSKGQPALSPNSIADPGKQSPASLLSLSSPEVSAVLESDTMPMYGSVPDLPSFCASRRNSHDDRLMQEGKQRNPLSKSATVSKEAIAHNPYAEFDVISDEEIAHSLSSYNPYTEIIKSGSKTDSRLHTTFVRTAADIAATGLTGVKGELWVNAGTQYGIPIVSNETGVLHWEFSTEPQRIAFSVAYKKSNNSKYDKFEMQPLLHTIHVNSSQHCVKGHVVMKNPGVYVLLFDNRFSRIAAKKVKYVLWINSVEECASSTCKENFDQE